MHFFVKQSKALVWNKINKIKVFSNGWESMDEQVLVSAGGG